MKLKKSVLLVITGCLLILSGCASFTINKEEPSGNLKFLENKFKWFHPWFRELDERSYRYNMNLLEKFINEDNDTPANKAKKIAVARETFAYEPNTGFQFTFDYDNDYIFKPDDVEIAIWDGTGRPIPVTCLSFGYIQGDINVHQWMIKTKEIITRERVKSPIKVSVIMFKACTFTYYVTPNN